MGGMIGGLGARSQKTRQLEWKGGLRQGFRVYVLRSEPAAMHCGATLLLLSVLS